MHRGVAVSGSPSIHRIILFGDILVQRSNDEGAGRLTSKLRWGPHDPYPDISLIIPADDGQGFQRNVDKPMA